MEGIRTHDIGQMPPFNQLTDKQKDEIRKLTLDIRSPVSRLEFFNKYPKIAYFSLYDLKSCIEYGVDDNRVKQAWENYKKYGEIGGYGIPDGLPDWVYQDITRTKFKNFRAETAGDILFKPDRYPQFFIDFIVKKFPIIAKGLYANNPKDIRALIRDFIEFPSMDNYEGMCLSINRNELKLDGDKYLYVSNREVSKEMVDFSFSSSLFSKVDKHKRPEYTNEYWVQSTDEMRRVISETLAAINRNEEFYATNDNPFSYFVDNSKQFGVLGVLYVGNGLCIKKQLLTNILKIISENVTKYDEWNLCWGHEASRQIKSNIDGISEKEIKKVEDNYSGIYLVSPDKYFDVSQGSKLSTNSSKTFDSYSNSSYLDKLVQRAHVTDKEYSEQFDGWLKTKIQSKTYNVKHQYLEIINSKGIKDLTEKASRDIFSYKVQNGRMLNAESCTPEFKKQYYEVWPFNINSAITFWTSVPMSIRDAVSKDIDIWFFCLSGLFSCSQIQKRMGNETYDLEKVVDHIQCVGDSEATRKILKAIIEEKKKKINEDIKNRFPEFLSSDSVKTHKLTDFPELYEYMQQLLRKHVDANKNGYSHKQQKSVPKIELAIEHLADINIYFINAQDYKNFWGADGMSFSPVNPDESGGFFAPAYSIWGNTPTIVVFTKNNEDITSDKILKELGLDNLKTANMGLTEEGTLWHEVSHAFMDYISPGRENYESKDKSADVWLSTPSEIAAITYGNIPHIKLRLKQYFTQMFPFTKRITAGLLEQIKSDVVQTFSMEFLGLKKEQAYQMIHETMPEFNQEILDALNSMSKEEQINQMSQMFSEFFIRRFMRSKVQSAIEMEMAQLGQTGEITFREEPVVPEPYTFKQQGQRDEFISQLESRPDYNQLINSCRQIVNNAYKTMNRGTYLDNFRYYIYPRQIDTLKNPAILEDLLAIIFGLPATINYADLSKLNPLFESVIPQSLVREVSKIVQNERVLKHQDPPKPEKKIVTPDEAEEAGQFMSEMQEQHGPDWIWLAKNMNWYKKASEDYYTIKIARNPNANPEILKKILE